MGGYLPPVAKATDRGKLSCKRASAQFHPGIAGFWEDETDNQSKWDVADVSLDMCLAVPRDPPAYPGTYCAAKARLQICRAQKVCAASSSLKQNA